MIVLKLILFVVLGAFIHLLFKLKSVIKRKDFKFRIFFMKNSIGSILTIALGITLILLKDDIFNMFGILINNFMAFFVGYTGDSVFKQLMKKAQTGVESKINEKK